MCKHHTRRGNALGVRAKALLKGERGGRSALSLSCHSRTFSTFSTTQDIQLLANEPTAKPKYGAHKNVICPEIPRSIREMVPSKDYEEKHSPHSEEYSWVTQVTGREEILGFQLPSAHGLCWLPVTKSVLQWQLRHTRSALTTGKDWNTYDDQILP